MDRAGLSLLAFLGCSGIAAGSLAGLVGAAAGIGWAVVFGGVLFTCGVINFVQFLSLPGKVAADRAIMVDRIIKAMGRA